MSGDDVFVCAAALKLGDSRDAERLLAIFNGLRDEVEAAEKRMETLRSLAEKVYPVWSDYDESMLRSAVKDLRNHLAATTPEKRP